MQGRAGESTLILPKKAIKSNSLLADIKLTVTNPTLFYPFLLDDDTVSHIRKSKVMFLLRGLPGSGKSTLAEILALKYPGSVVCSADQYFVKDGVYRWCRTKLKEAHESCHQLAQQTCANGRHLIVDNSNIRSWELSFYFQLAKLHSYITVLVETKTSWRRDVSQLAIKTNHDVDVKTLEFKLEKYELVIPLYYGWFLNKTGSRELYGIAKAYLKKCSKLPNFKKVYQLDAQQYYSNCAIGSISDILHCTAYYCDQGEVDGSEEYAYRDCVRKSYGKALQLNVIGFIITPRTFGARVKLSPQNLSLWNNDDHEKPSTRVTRVGVSQHQTGPLSLAASLSTLKISGAGRGIGGRNDAQGTSSARRGHTPCIWVESDISPAQFYKPCKGRGSRAHITLGCSADYEPVQTGLDQIEIVQLENTKGFQRLSVVTLDPLADACDYGKGRWVIYLKKQLALKAVFTGCY